jgi:IclR family pca regulon transcriptional regulator
MARAAKPTSPEERPDPNDREYVQSLERGIKVLRAFDARNPRLTLSEVAVIAGLNRATARRLLLTLIRMSLVATNGKVFWLRPSILDLGFRYLSGLPWWHISQPIIEELAKEVQEPCSISVLDGQDIVYVARAVINRIVSTDINIGSRFPAFCTAAGRAILSQIPPDDLEAYLADVVMKPFTDQTVTNPSKLRELIIASRQKGYAVSDGELEVALFGIAVPIFDKLGRPVAALSVSTHVTRHSPTQITKRILPRLREGARKITEHLQLQEFQPGGSISLPAA